MKNLFLFLVVLLMCSCTTALKKSDLKVLYVGGSSEWDSYSNPDTATFRKSVVERMNAFETMLNKYFNSVTVVHANDYTQALSYAHDVTVMDGTPKVITPRVTETDAAGNTTGYLAAGYLTEDFDRPMVTIGELGEKLGRRIGLKTDWYCLCLDADAHHLRKEHPIFRTPFPVDLTMSMKPTPEGAYHYTYYVDGSLPDSILMWKVQTKGYMTDKGFRIGMVARPWGFEDSPEAEYISSGVCAKTLDAVAIGRHGNFLHWGFAASPTYMTEEGQTVLANAIVYITQFAGQTPIARKYNDRLATREYLRELKHLATRESYEERMKSDDEFYAARLEQQKEVLEKQKRGETLTSLERQLVGFKRPAQQSFEDYIKRYQRDFFHLFGTNTAAYIKFYDENQDYFYSEGFYHFEVDEDVKSLGIPNSDKRILDAAIKMLESGKEVEKGKRILARYTLRDFSTPAEWRKWYKTNKNRIFFTEGGGFLFLVNSREPGENDYHARNN